MAVPAIEVLKIPEERPMVATPVAPLVHTPPGVLLASVVPAPAQRVMVPVTGSGVGLTVKLPIRTQPAGVV